MKYDPKDTIEYYNRHSAGYDKNNYNSKKGYNPNLYRQKIVESLIAKLPKGKILDAGCGTGLFLTHLVENNYECSGCDISSGMLQQAKNNLEKVTDKNIFLVETPLNDLSMFDDASFDNIVSLGVLPYIPEEEEAACYQELRRVIKPGGYFISAHENELFDLFTFNKYTLRFFRRNFLPLLKMESVDINEQEIIDDLSKLIVNPDMPENKDSKKSARDIIFIKPDNPITYPSKLAQYNFINEDMYYYHFHAMPPIIRNSNKEVMELSKKLEIKYSNKWQGMFLASTFISVSRAIEN